MNVKSQKSPIVSSNNDYVKPSAIELGTYGSDSSEMGTIDASGVPLSGKTEWNNYILIVGLLCALSSFNYGINIGNISGIIKYFGNCTVSAANATGTFSNCIPVTSEGQKSLVVASFCIGGLLGALSTGILTNKFGRRKVLLSHNLFYIGGALLMSLSTHLAMLIVGRFLIGLGSGSCTVVVPMYLAEIATDGMRGSLGIMHQAAIVLGILVAQILALFMVPDYWRIYIGFVIIFAAVQMIILWMMGVETPKYLASTGRLFDAENVLKGLRNSENVNEELNTLIKARADSDKQRLSIQKLIMLRAARMSLLVGCVYHAAQQLSGINVLFYYGDTVFAGLKFKDGVVVVMIGAVNVVMTAVSIWLIDKAGRRPLMLCSSFGLVISCVLLTIFVLLKFEIGAVISVLLFVASFAVGMGPVPWVIIGDLFPTESLDASNFICTGVNWTCNTLIALITPELADKMTTKYLFIPFGVVSAATYAFSFFLVPETKGKVVTYL